MGRRFRDYGDPELIRRPESDLGPLFAKPAAVPYQPSSRTSRAAAEKVKRDIERRRELVYVCICVAGPRGLAGFEIAERTGLSILSVRPRVSNLLDDQEIEETGEERVNANQYPEMVVRVREKTP